MANFRGAAFLGSAIESVLAQSLGSLELIVVDDGSPDGSVDIVEAYRAQDPRVRLVRLAGNHGPAGARNRGLDCARGEWIAIVDSDDFIHPDRLETLVRSAECDGADIVADDLLIFDEGSTKIGTMLPTGTAPFWVETAAFIRANSIYASGPILGYCKPIIRASSLGERRYDETLRIGEDFDLLFRLLNGGARFRIYPELFYFYRKHSGSISHRFNDAECRRLIEAGHRQIQDTSPASVDVRAAHAYRMASLERALAFAGLVHALKAHSLPGIVQAIRGNPRALTLLRLPVAAMARRMIGRFRLRTAPSSSGKRVVLLSRQRIVGPTNGSSAYLLSMAAYLREQGLRVAYRSPSPATFGRWPFLVVGPAMRTAFESVAIHGGLRIGSVIFARDPAIWIKAALTVAEDVALKCGLVRRRRIAPAPYAVSVPLTRRDQLYVARHARNADAFLLDYAFLTAARPYTLQPHAKALIVMHDLFSNREAQFAKAGAADSVARLSRSEEITLLSRGDGVIAIQKEEADIVAKALPGKPVIVAPMAAVVRDAAAGGRDGTLLFVGSNTAPNVIGLQWFLQAVWPLILERHPAASLEVAGSVSRGLDAVPGSVKLLGIVPDLAPVYEAAGVVISPLTVGSGLKIKLIEAMGQGKAIVATSVTVEGVADRVADAVAVTDSPTDFAEHVIALLSDSSRRVLLGEAARTIAAEFAAADCYGPIARYLFDVESFSRLEDGNGSSSIPQLARHPGTQRTEMAS